MAGSTGVVIAALIANAAIGILKFVAFLLTGSPAMLSETYHSISDTGNQVFLLIGIRYGSRDADRRHPFGYGKAQFFFAFLVAVMLFGIAGWASASHGYEKLMHPSTHGGGDPVTLFGTTFEPVMVSYAVLAGAFLFEGYALMKARAEMKRQMAEHGWGSYREAFRKTSDVTTLTALTEDTIALTGIFLAFAGILATQMTGNPVYDAASAFLIGIMLMGFAVALGWENKRLIMGESVPRAEEARLKQVVRDQTGVDDIVDFRTVYFGPEQLVVTADVAFEAGIKTATMDDYITDIEDALRTAEPSIEKVYIEPEY